MGVWGKRCVRFGSTSNFSGLKVISSAVEGHFDHPHGRPWASVVDHVHPLMAEIVGENASSDIQETASLSSRTSGANTEEVCVMGTLTANLHLMMCQFYKPTSERYKLFCEARAFPSDQVGSLITLKTKQKGAYMHRRTLMRLS